MWPIFLFMCRYYTKRKIQSMLPRSSRWTGTRFTPSFCATWVSSSCMKSRCLRSHVSEKDHPAFPPQLRELRTMVSNQCITIIHQTKRLTANRPAPWPTLVVSTGFDKSCTRNRNKNKCPRTNWVKIRLWVRATHLADVPPPVHTHIGNGCAELCLASCSAGFQLCPTFRLALPPTWLQTHVCAHTLACPPAAPSAWNLIRCFAWFTCLNLLSRSSFIIFQPMRKIKSLMN